MCRLTIYSPAVACLKYGISLVCAEHSNPIRSMHVSTTLFWWRLRFPLEICYFQSPSDKTETLWPIEIKFGSMNYLGEISKAVHLVLVPTLGCLRYIDYVKKSLLSFFFYFLGKPSLLTAEPIVTLNGSNNSVWCMEDLFGGHFSRNKFWGEANSPNPQLFRSLRGFSAKSKS